MSGLEIVLIAVLALFVLLATTGQRAAYRNGVTDGYGYSREPNNPGYEKAGEILRRDMSHRWPELSE